MGALIFDRGRILMAQRGKEPLKGWWSLPGGAVEIGESLDDAQSAARCAKRRGWRSSLSACSRSSSASCATTAGAPEYHYVLIDYICRVTGGTLCAGDDVCARGMGAARQDLGNLQITEGTLGVIEKAFRERRRYK